MIQLPQAYIAQMKRLLGEAGFFAYERALSQPVTRALRINLLTHPDSMPPCAIEGLGERVPWRRARISWRTARAPAFPRCMRAACFTCRSPAP